ncbi:hypothetical protein BSFA1_51180 [Burkholderia sp. SFA1]|nr:hypothetical protein BSFA1_51180 [Burkholderia sp. SFA1]
MRLALEACFERALREAVAKYRGRAEQSEFFHCDVVSVVLPNGLKRNQMDRELLAYLLCISGEERPAHEETGKWS